MTLGRDFMLHELKERDALSERVSPDTRPISISSALLNNWKSQSTFYYTPGLWFTFTCNTLHSKWNNATLGKYYISFCERFFNLLSHISAEGTGTISSAFYFKYCVLLRLFSYLLSPTVIAKHL